MQGKSKKAEGTYNNELGEELSGVLTAISIVARNLARKLAVIEKEHECKCSKKD